MYIFINLLIYIFINFTDSKRTDSKHTDSKHTDSKHTDSQHTESKRTDNKNIEKQHPGNTKRQTKKTHPWHAIRASAVADRIQNYSTEEPHMTNFNPLFNIWLVNSQGL